MAKLSFSCPHCEIPIKISILDSKPKIKIKSESYAFENPIRIPSSITGDADYVIVTKIGALLSVYKQMQGFHPADRAWDILGIPQWSGAAKSLLQRFDGNYDRAKACLIDIGESWKAKGLSWSLRAVLRGADDWEQKNGN